MATSKVLQRYNTDITVNNKGLIKTESSVTVLAECRLDYKNYPFENSTCSIMLVSPLTNSMKLLFSDIPMILPRDSIFGHDENNMTKGANFDVIGMNAERYFYYPGGVTKNATM